MIKRETVPFLVREYVQLPQVNMQGFDLDLSYRFSAKFNYKGTAAWVSAKTKEGTPLIDTPPLNIQQQLAYSPIQDNPLRLVFKPLLLPNKPKSPILISTITSLRMEHCYSFGGHQLCTFILSFVWLFGRNATVKKTQSQPCWGKPFRCGLPQLFESIALFCRRNRTQYSR